MNSSPQQQAIGISVPTPSHSPLESAHTPLDSTAQPVPRLRRPANAWLLYRKDRLTLLSERDAKRPQGELSTAIAAAWKAEPPEVKRTYEEAAQRKKEEHLAAHPEYRYMPRKRGERAASPRKSVSRQNLSKAATQDITIAESSGSSESRHIRSRSYTAPSTSEGGEEGRAGPLNLEPLASPTPLDTPPRSLFPAFSQPMFEQPSYIYDFPAPFDPNQLYLPYGGPRTSETLSTSSSTSPPPDVPTGYLSASPSPRFHGVGSSQSPSYYSMWPYGGVQQIEVQQIEGQQRERDGGRTDAGLSFSLESTAFGVSSSEVNRGLGVTQSPTYSFPPRPAPIPHAHSFPSASYANLPSFSFSGPTSDVSTRATTYFEDPPEVDWKAFRDVRVRRDDVHGIPLQTLLLQLSQEAAMATGAGAGAAAGAKTAYDTEMTLAQRWIPEFDPSQH